jgi:hypothetical protein
VRYSFVEVNARDGAVYLLRLAGGVTFLVGAVLMAVDSRRPSQRSAPWMPPTCRAGTAAAHAGTGLAAQCMNACACKRDRAQHGLLIFGSSVSSIGGLVQVLPNAREH